MRIFSDRNEECRNVNCIFAGLCLGTTIIYILDELKLSLSDVNLIRRAQLRQLLQPPLLLLFNDAWKLTGSGAIVDYVHYTGAMTGQCAAGKGSTLIQAGWLR